VIVVRYKVTYCEVHSEYEEVQLMNELVMNDEEGAYVNKLVHEHSASDCVVPFGALFFFCCEISELCSDVVVNE